MTSLTDRLKSFEPDLNGTAPSGDGRNAVEIIDRDSFEKLKTIAVMLSEKLAEIESVQFADNQSQELGFCAQAAQDAITKAAEMLESGK